MMTSGEIPLRFFSNAGFGLGYQRIGLLDAKPLSVGGLAVRAMKFRRDVEVRLR